MTVNSTPVSGRVRFTYLDNLPDLRINGILPTATASQIANLVSGIQSLQTGTINDGFLIVESELEETGA